MRKIKQNGFEKTIVSVIYPFLARTGVLWQTGIISPAQEHFISNIIRRKIIVAIDQLGPVKIGTKPAFILFLPEGEYHEIGLLFFNYLIKKNGINTVYLGQSVPFADIIEVQKTYNAENLISVFTTELSDLSVLEYINQLASTFKKQKIFVSGYLTNMLEFKKNSNIVKLKSLEFFEEVLQKMQ
jgi:methanogenic corrinoid protein MtbC1